MPRYVVANWKSHKSPGETEQWLARFQRVYSPDPRVEVVLAPSFISLAPLAEQVRALEMTGISLAVQDLSPFPLGSYTGGVAAAMVRGLAAYAMVGHSERRRYFHETHQDVANKASEAISAGITPIVCVDIPYVRAQVAAIPEADLGAIMIGYGPVEAIGVTAPQSPSEAAKGIAAIRVLCPDIPLLYGGSIQSDNALTYMALDGVDGLMVGTASLDPEEFASICRAIRGE